MNIKSLLAIVALCLFFVSCKNDKNKFIIVGEITSMPQQTVLLEEMGIGHEIKVLDSAKSNSKGHFELSGAGSEPGLYRIHFAENRFIFVSVFKENVKIIGEWDRLINYTVTGSPASTSLNAFFISMDQYINNIQTLYMIKDTMRMRGNDSLFQKASLQIDDEKVKLMQYIEHYADTTIFVRNAIFVVSTLNKKSEKPFLDAFAASLPTRFPDKQLVKDYISLYKKGGIAETNTAPQGPIEGAFAPEISLNTPDGAVVTLSSFKGKYVLVDFWASWCTPCRRENPNVVAAYKMFKDKNFTILGVSLDNDQDKWRAAIAQDHLEWTHVSDLKGWESVAARDYNISSIPSNFLIDPNGKIIGVDLRGPELEDALSKLLQ